MVAFVLGSMNQQKEKSILASSAIIDIVALIFNLVVFGILTKNHIRGQTDFIYEFTKEKEEPKEPLIQNFGTQSSTNQYANQDHGGCGNPAYENNGDDSVFTPNPDERVPGRSGTTTVTPNAAYQSGSRTPLSQANPNYVPITGLSINTGSSHHTGSTINAGNESINNERDNTEPSLKNTSYISDATAQRMGNEMVAKKKSDEPYMNFTKSNDTQQNNSNQKIGQTVSLPIDAAQVEPEYISEDSDVEDSYRPNETSAYADILVKDSAPTTTQSKVNVQRHNTMEVNNNQLLNDSYVTMEANAPKAYVFAKDPGPNQNEEENRKIERQKSIVKNIAYKN